ncbi:MAG: family 16 glycoside hydrolase, partial [Bacteroidota bacterium]
LASDEKQKRHNGNLCTPGTQVSIGGQPVAAHCIDSKSKNSYVNEWVTAEAIVYGDSLIHHVIDGDTVLTYEKTQVGGGFVNTGMTWTTGGFAADSSLWIKKDGTPLSSGYVALQAESHPVEFRKVELLNLEGCTDRKAINYKSYFVKSDNSKCRYK